MNGDRELSARPDLNQYKKQAKDLIKGLNVGTQPHGETGLHWASYAGHADTVKVLLKWKAPLNTKDKRFGGTPLGWALYGWCTPAPEANRAGYYEVVARLVAAGATVEQEWLADPNRELPIPQKVRADDRMLAALRGELPRQPQQNRKWPL